MASTLRVIDTSAWIEWLIDSSIGKRLARVLSDREHCLVPTIVQLELSKWLRREIGEDEADQMIAYTQKCVIAPLDTSIALLAAELHSEHKLATADSVIYATARQHGAGLMTCDAHFKGLPGVTLLTKSSRGQP